MWLYAITSTAGFFGCFDQVEWHQRFWPYHSEEACLLAAEKIAVDLGLPQSKWKIECHQIEIAKRQVK